MSSSPFVLRRATEPVACATLEQVAREGAGRALQQAIENEVAKYLAAAREARDEDGRRLMVRNGHKPERVIPTRVGPLRVRQPRVEDRRVGEDWVRFRFMSKVLPPNLRKTRAIADPVLWQYLKGIATGEMSDALVHLGFDGSRLSAASISRMKHDQAGHGQRRRGRYHGTSSANRGGTFDDGDVFASDHPNHLGRRFNH